MPARSALADYGSEGSAARNHEFSEPYEGKIIPFPNSHGENVKNIEITNLLRSLLRSENPQGVAMTDPTREEFDAKLATVEARTETRFVELGGKMDRVGDEIGALTSAVTTVRTEVKEDGKFTRWTVGVTLIASLIAFGAALWVTQGNILSAFQAGLLLKSEQVAPSPPAPRPSSPSD